jgi:hypothetical protein
MSAMVRESDAAPALSDEGAAARESGKQPPSAALRLAESRERLRQWMLRGDGRHQARRRKAAALAEGLETSLLDKLRAMPVIGIIVDAASAWWSSHPLHSAAQIAQDAARGSVAPLARRHPLALAAAAFAAGGLLVWLRPWRMFKPALFAGLASQVAGRVIAHIPIETVLASFAAFAYSQVHAADKEDEEGPADADEADASEAPAMPAPASQAGPPKDVVIH